MRPRLAHRLVGVGRDTGAAIEAAGFTIERSERFGLSAGLIEPSVPHILGVARRP